MKILVTGGAGFIGRAVCAALLKAQHEPVSFDLALRHPEGAAHLCGSVLDKAALARAVKGCDAVIHLAALLGVAHSEAEPEACLETGITGTRNVVHAARRAGVERLIYSSSSEVYGDADRVPTPETSPPRPQSVYAVSKLAGEQHVKTFPHHWTILRLFNVYGPGQSERFVVARFTQQAREGQPLTVYGTGGQVRAFCHVTDVADAFVRALNAPAAAKEIINIGNNHEPVTMAQLAKDIIKYFRPGGPLAESVRYVAYANADRPRARDIPFRCPDVRKAARLLGWSPQINLAQGLRRSSHRLAEVG